MIRLFFACLAVAAFNCAAQDVKLVPFNNAGAWGYSDLKKNIRISCNYDDALPFRYGIAVCLKNGKSGAIDKNNKVLVDFSYDKLNVETPDLLTATLNNKAGIISKDGKVILPLAYSRISAASDLFFIAGDSVNDRLVGLDGKVVYTTEDIDWEDELGFFIVEGKTDSASRRGMLGPKGNIFIPQEYDRIEASVTRSKRKDLEKLYQEALRKKEIFSRTMPESFIYFVQKNNKWGVINGNGELIIPCEYDNISDDVFEEKGLYMAEKNGLFFFMDAKGKALHNTKIDHVDSDVRRNIPAEISFQDKKGLLGKNLQVMIAPLFDDVDYEKNSKLVTVTLNKKMACTVTPVRDLNNLHWYDNISNVRSIKRDGWGRVQSNNKYGVIDTNGRIIVECKYDYIRLQDGFVRAEDSLKETAFDKKGRQLFTLNHGSILTMYLPNGNGFVIRQGDSIYLAKGKDKKFVAAVSPEAYYTTQRTFFENGDCYWTYLDENEYVKMVKISNGNYTSLIREDLTLESEDLDQQASFFRKNDTLFILDKYGNKLPGYYKEFIDIFRGSDTVLKFYVVKDFNGNSGLTDLNGKTVIPANEPRGIDFQDDYCNGSYQYFYYCNNNSQLYVPKTNTFSKTPFYDHQCMENTDLFVINNDKNEYALLNKSGQELTGFDYSELHPFEEESNYPFFMARDKNTGKTGTLDTNGKAQVPFEFEQIVYGEIEGVLLCSDTGKNYSVYSIFGKKLLPLSYKEVTTLYSDMFSVTDTDGMTRVYNSEGKCLTKVKAPMVEVAHRVTIGGKELLRVYFEKPDGNGITAYADADGILYYSE